MQLTIIATILVALVGAFFAIQNNVPVTIKFLLWRFDSSLAVVLPLGVAFGAIVVALLTTPATLKRQWLLARQKRRIDEMEKTAASLRDRITELETHLSPEATAEKPPYVGLKQLIIGLGNESADGSRTKQN
ncbi:conserved protein of unknown function [Georgfuchsia toluolica]|uniref:Lipopolysaccharide assembly protein A domain-containing protein n=1 Tax=Georgfuchsia toluolica TaxID=424218 RepID=A0A916N2D6_9PROT|nr:LapA family protein [Georgfuchsia toluolica]CAG4883749.1 conserved protein of unknown function [Georgfuchsia toluolica]